MVPAGAADTASVAPDQIAHVLLWCVAACVTALGVPPTPGLAAVAVLCALAATAAALVIGTGRGQDTARRPRASRPAPQAARPDGGPLVQTMLPCVPAVFAGAPVRILRRD